MPKNVTETAVDFDNESGALVPNIEIMLRDKDAEHNSMQERTRIRVRLSATRDDGESPSVILYTVDLDDALNAGQRGQLIAIMQALFAEAKSNKGFS